MSGLFICYEKVKEGLARITNTCSVVEHAPYAQQLAAQGIKFYFIPMDGFTGFFELDSDDQVIAIDTREEFGNKFDKTSVEILETATIRGVPPCQIEVQGGRYQETIDHPGGDFALRFSLPGDYVVSFEAFPALRQTTTLSVKSPVESEPLGPRTVVEQPLTTA